MLGDIYICDSDMFMDLKSETEYNGSILLSAVIEIKYEKLKMIIFPRLQE